MRKIFQNRVLYFNRTKNHYLLYLLVLTLLIPVNRSQAVPGDSESNPIWIQIGDISGTLPGPASDGSIWYEIYLYTKGEYTFNLTGLGGTDFDLFVYTDSMTLIGQASSMNYPDILNATNLEGFYLIKIFPYSGAGAFDLNIKPSGPGEFRYSVRLDEVYMYDDMAGIWDGYFYLDMYINDEFINTWPSSAWQIRGDSGQRSYFDFGSTYSLTEIPHPTSGGITYSDYYDVSHLNLTINMREVGLLETYDHDAGWISIDNETSVEQSLYEGWVWADSGNYKIYFYIDLIDDTTPDIMEAYHSPTGDEIRTDTPIDFSAWVRDYNAISSVNLEYEFNFGSTQIQSMSFINQNSGYNIYETTLGTLAYGTYVSYMIWANDTKDQRVGLGSSLVVGQPLSQARSFDLLSSYSGYMSNYQRDYYNFTLTGTNSVNITVIWNTDAALGLALFDGSGQILEISYGYDPLHPGQQILTVPQLTAGDYYVKLSQGFTEDFRTFYQIYTERTTGSIAPVISDVIYPASILASNSAISIDFNVTDDILVSDIGFEYSFDDGNTWDEITNLNGYELIPYTLLSADPQYQIISDLTEKELIYVNCTWDIGYDADNMDFDIHRPGTTEINASYLTSIAGSALGSADTSPELGTIKILESGDHLLEISNFGGIIPQTGLVTIIASHLSVTITGPFPENGIPVKFRIEAKDNDNHQSYQSFEITVTDDISPEITILHPVTGQKYNVDPITFSYSTTDDNVVWYLNEVFQGAITNNTAVSIPEGEDQNITVVATDLGGLNGYDTVIVSVDLTQPIVQIDLPIDGTYINSNSFQIDYQVTDSHIVSDELVNHVIVYLNEQDMGYRDSGYTFSGLFQGTYNITVIATDTFGNVGKDTVFVTIDTDTPIVNFLSPNPVIYSNSLIDIQYSYTETGTIAFFLNEASYPFVTNDSLIQFPDGIYNLTITVTDQAGNVGVHSVLFTVDTTPPNVEIISPYQDYYNVTDLPIMWTLEPGTIVNDIIIDGFGTILINNSVRSFSEGNHNVTLVVEDSAGNIKVVSRIFTIDVTNPDLEIISPISQIYDYADILLVYSSDEPLSIIAIYIDGELVSVSNNSQTSSLSEGEHTLIIRVTDLAGNTAQASVTFTIELPVTTTTTSSTTSEAGTGFSFILFFPALFILLVILRRSKIE